MDVREHQREIEAALAACRTARDRYLRAVNQEAELAWQAFLAREHGDPVLPALRDQLHTATAETRDALSSYEAACDQLEAARYCYRAEHEEGFARRHPTLATYRRAMAALEAASR